MRKFFAIAALVIFFVFAPNASEAAGSKRIGEKCSDAAFGDDECVTNQCEDSNIDESDDNYCVCDKPSDCANEYGTDNWQCKNGGDNGVEHNVNFCLGEKSGPRYVPSGRKTGDVGILDAISDPEAFVKATGNEIEAIVKKPQPRIKIPGLDFTNVKDLPIGQDESGQMYLYIPYIGEYIAAVYKYGIVLAGVLGVIMLIFAGFQWMIYPEDHSKAKERILKAITGIIIAVGSYSILYIINPNLVQFKSLRVAVVKQIDFMPGFEPTEIKMTKGQECFFNTFGKTQEEVRSKLVDVELTTASGSQVKIAVHQLMAPSLRNAVEKMKKINYKIKTAGSFNWRANRNYPDSISLHSFGIAFDINPDANPNYRKNNSTEVCKTDMPNELINALKDDGFLWGGIFKTVCDSMHFEWRGPCAK